MTPLVLVCWLGLASTAQPKAEPTTASATITLQDVDVGELLDKLKVKLGLRLGGKVTVRATMAVQLGDATNAKAYTFRGTVTSDELAVAGTRIQKLVAKAVYSDGKFALTELVGSVATGEFRGTATAAIEPRGDLVAELNLKGLPLDTLDKSVVAGAVDGKLEFRSPLNDLGDLAKWIATADLKASALTILGRSVGGVRLKLAAKDGLAKLTEFTATVEGVPLDGNGTLTLSGKFPFAATARTRPKDVGELQKLVPELQMPIAVRGTLTAEANVAGTLNPPALAASGTLAASNLAIGESPPGKLSAKWKVAPDRVTVTDFSSELFRGKLAGSADLPLQPDRKGDFQLSFTDIDATDIGKAFPRMPVRVTGQVTGRIVGAIPIAKSNVERAITADVTLASDRLTVQGIPAEKLTGKLALEGEIVRYELEGKTLGGTFEVNGRYPEPKEPKDERGMLRLRRIDLARLMEALRWPGVPLRGRFDLTFEYSPNLNDGNGRYSIRGLRWGRSRLIAELGGRLVLRNGQFEASDATGPIAGGSIRARVRARLDDPARNFFRLDLERADLGRLLAAFTGEPDLIVGGASLSVRGKLWPEFRATGTVGLPRGQIGGLTATDVRVPFTVVSRAGGGEFTVRDAVGTIGNGRATAQLESHWGAGGRLSGQIRFANVQIGNVFADLKQSNYFGSARATGRIDLGGENVRGADDVTAAVSLTLAKASARELPVLERISPFVPPAAFLRPFETGELRGRLARGLFRIERLALANSSADLYADGTVGLDGRLDLAVIVRTGPIGANDVALRQAGIQLAALATPVPVRLVRSISDLLSNRTVRLSVTGTLASPQPRVNAAALLTEEAIRYLLRQSLFSGSVSAPLAAPRTAR